MTQGLRNVRRLPPGRLISCGVRAGFAIEGKEVGEEKKNSGKEKGGRRDWR